MEKISKNKFQKMNPIQHNQIQSFRPEKKGIQNCATQPRQSSNFDPFGTFLYKDQYTHRRYKISKLKTTSNSQSTKRTKTVSHDKKNEELAKYYIEELKMFRKIRQNRNKNRIGNFKKVIKKNSSHEKDYDQSVDVNIIKHEIRKQVLNMNQQYLREYLYHEKPFNNKFLKLHKISDVGALNEKKIKEIKKMIKQCGKDTLKKNKQKLSGRNTCASTNKEHLASEKRLNEKKKKIQVEIDGKFQTIWDRLEKDIQRKVRKEGQYNWQQCRHKLRK